MASSSCEYGLRCHALGFALRAGREQMPEVREPQSRLWLEAVVDPRSATLGAHDARLAQHFQVMRDGGLAHAATIGEVARADLAVGSQLLNDREARGLGEGLEDLHVVHGDNISTNLDIDKHQYRDACCGCR